MLTETCIWVRGVYILRLSYFFKTMNRPRVEQGHKGHYQSFSRFSRAESPVCNSLHIISYLITNSEISATCQDGIVMVFRLRVRQ